MATRELDYGRQHPERVGRRRREPRVCQPTSKTSPTAGPGTRWRCFTLLTEGGARLTRPLRWVGQVLRHQVNAFKLAFPMRWSRRTIILLVMQTLDNALRLRPVRVGRSVFLQTEQDPDNPNPTYIPVANRAAEALARRMGGIAQSSIDEALFNTAATALAEHAMAGVPSADGSVAQLASTSDS